MLARHQLIKPRFSLLSHWLWSVLLLSALLTLLIRFIAFDYQFVWQTTLLSPQQIDTILALFHTLPSWFGLSAPHLNATPGNELLNSDFNRYTALWLLSCVLLYALLPRVLLLVACALWLSRNTRMLAIDWSLPGFAELRQEWQRRDTLEIEPAPSQIINYSNIDNVNDDSNEGPANPSELTRLIVTLDWPDPDHQALATTTHIAPLLAANHQQQRSAILSQIHQNGTPPATLVLVNANVSPDRGTLRFLQALASHAVLSIGLCESTEQSRYALWRDYLAENLVSQAKLLDTELHSRPHKNLAASAAELISQWTK